MLHSHKLRSLAVLASALFILDSCKKDAVDPSLEIENARARTKTKLTAVQQLGKQIFFDARLSEPMGVQSCASCHAPQVGFSGFGDIPTGGAASASGFKRGFVAGIGEGAVIGAFGRRKPPTAAYATLVPVMDFDGVEFTGGLFWDGRATGLRLGSTAAEQALGPFLADKEQNHPGPASVLAKLKNNRSYLALWNAAFGTTEIDLSNEAAILSNYDNIGLAIDAYEGSSEVNQYSSKFDAFQAGRYVMTAQEAEGMALFNNQAGCNDCHKQLGGNRNRPFVVGELFADFAYHNIGIPQNPNNPGGNLAPDPGLAGFLATSDNLTWRAQADANFGKFRTPTLRNVGKAQRFMHNGVFSSLEEVVHFYNTRDVPGAGWNGVPWGTPEYLPTMDTEALGDLGLTPAQEAAVVAFLRTMDDGYTGPVQ
jgi:cytochrome c peroxidase